MAHCHVINRLNWCVIFLEFFKIYMKWQFRPRHKQVHHTSSIKIIILKSLFEFVWWTVQPIHTADAGATQLSSCVASAVCIGMVMYFLFVQFKLVWVGEAKVKSMPLTDYGWLNVYRPTSRLTDTTESEVVFETSAEGGSVFGSVCSSVCPSVRRITEKVVNRFLRNFLEGEDMAQGPMSSILVTIRITIRIRESVPDHDPYTVSGDELAFGRGLCSLSTSSYCVFRFLDEPCSILVYYRNYVAAKSTYIRLLHGKIVFFWVFSTLAPLKWVGPI